MPHPQSNEPSGDRGNSCAASQERRHITMRPTLPHQHTRRTHLTHLSCTPTQRLHTRLAPALSSGATRCTISAFSATPGDREQRRRLASLTLPMRPCRPAPHAPPPRTCILLLVSPRPSEPGLHCSKARARLMHLNALSRQSTSTPVLPSRLATRSRTRAPSPRPSLPHRFFVRLCDFLSETDSPRFAQCTQQLSVAKSSVIICFSLFLFYLTCASGRCEAGSLIDVLHLRDKQNS
jgi:hypothetical protein